MLLRRAALCENNKLHAKIKFINVSVCFTGYYPFSRRFGSALKMLRGIKRRFHVVVNGFNVPWPESV